jgi:hypothetical protein
MRPKDPLSAQGRGIIAKSKKQQKTKNPKDSEDPCTDCAKYLRTG